MVAAIAVLTKDAGKLTMGQPLVILAPHAVEALVKQPPDRWLSNARMTHYQALLLDTDRVQFRPVVALNPATLLPLPEKGLQHNCLDILAEAHGTRPDLTDQPLPDADHTWYTDGSSLLQEGQRKAGAAVTTETEKPSQPRKKTAKVVNIFPRFGMLQVLGTDNGPAFVSKVSQTVADLLGIDWKLHCAYRPQSSGQVERINRTIKETLTKLTLATGSRDWVLLLPLALYRARNTPGPHGLTPYEILCGAPPPLVNFPDPDMTRVTNSPSLQAHIQALYLVQHEVWRPLAAAYQEQLDHPLD
ncbi:pol polyprotein fragment [Moloney murine sarcoma virus]|uniref:pol polyprotein fragment n=1 Tax=Moloney murine sarcoma virus TaxID=11809 RepID=UPI0000163789|nr:pol polyprotein fragment [Moloney murine sarcoma virus]